MFIIRYNVDYSAIDDSVMVEITLTQELTSLFDRNNKILASLNVSIPLIPRKEQIFEDVLP